MNIFLGLGSNIGDHEENFKKALAELEKRGVKIVKISSLYESEPFGYLDQPWFYNMVAQAETDLSPKKLLKTVLAIELDLGRKREIPNGPRTIDIDILFYGNEIINQPQLKVPHPHLHERKCVLMPLLEIAPDFVHPVLKKNIAGLLKQCADQSIVRLL